MTFKDTLGEPRNVNEKGLFGGEERKGVTAHWFDFKVPLFCDHPFYHPTSVPHSF